MRVVLNIADLVKILGKHFGGPLTESNVKILTDPFEIDVRDVEEQLLSTPPAPKTTVAEELNALLTSAAEQIAAETGKHEEVLTSESATLSIDQLLDPTVSRHSAEGDAPPPPKREPLPPLPKLNDYFGNEDDTADGAENVHYDDPGETTAAEVDAARRQRKGGR